MDCAACGTPMMVLEQDKVELDYCAACGGAWLDSGELGLLLGSEAEGLLKELGGQSGEKRRKCPICLRRMQKVSCGTGAEARLDRCPGGDGLWFDRGELEEVFRSDGVAGRREVSGFLKDVFGKK